MAIRKETKRMIGWVIVALIVGSILATFICVSGWFVTLLAVGLTVCGVGLAILFYTAIDWIKGE